MSNILEKPISALTAAELEILKKPLGVRGRPYPMRETVQVDDGKGGKVLQRRLGVLQNSDQSFAIYSDRSYAEVLGMAMREMPTPGMLRLFYQAVNLRKPESKRRIQYLKGAAGSGKTYMSELIARMRSEKGAIKIDCGNKNLNELLYETVLDFGGARDLRDELDKRLANGALKNPMTATILRDALGEAFIQKGDKIHIEWEKVGHSLRDHSQTDKKEEERDYLDSRTASTIALEALKKVSWIEGIDSLGANSLGMATQEGPLIRAWREGREIILDEFNRAKEGTTSSLHTILQFLAGEIDETTVENTLKEKGDATSQTFTFRRSDQKAGFFATLTGNAEEDGHDVNELPQSLNSRIIPRTVPMATEEDWQHRICQIMTGLPISTIYRSDPERIKADPEKFRKKLLELRTLGLSDEQAAQVPDIQIRLLNRWQDVMEASEKLARLYYGWSQVVNPDSPLHRQGNLAKLLEEVSERYSAEVSIDFRKIIDHINEAMTEHPAIIGVEQSDGIDDSDWSNAPMPPSEVEPEDAGLHFGDRLVSVIMNYIVETTVEVGKTGLYNQLRQLAADCGLQQEVLHEAKEGIARSVADLLNDNPFRSPLPTVQAEVARDIHCSYLREIHKEIAVPNESLISVPFMLAALENLNDEDDVAPANQRAPFILLNTSPATLYQEPLRKIEVMDGISLASVDAAVPAAQDLASRTALLYALAIPAIREHNLEALWARSFEKAGLFSGGSNGVPKDQSIAMADGDKTEDLAITSVVVADKGRGGRIVEAPVHVVWNRKNDRMLVVGTGGASSDLKRAFNSVGAVYVDRQDREAAPKVQAALGQLMGPDRSNKEGLLKNAFLMRATLGDAEADEKSSLGDLLIRRDTQVFLPVYVTEKPVPQAA